METLYGPAYIASYLGASPSNISNWMKRDNSFPAPRIQVEGVSGVATRAWSEEQLPALRQWMSDHLGLTESEAAKHWQAIDDLRARGLSTKALAPPQDTALFDRDTAASWSSL